MFGLWEPPMTEERREKTNGDEDVAGPRRMLNEKQLLEIVPVGRTTLYRMEKTGRFPRSTCISPNRRVWLADQIVAGKRPSMNSIRTVAGAKGRHRVVSG
jgi:prophage regulatory protein